MKQLQLAVWLIFLSGLPGAGFTQESSGSAQTLSLQQAVERALSNHPALQIQRFAVEYARGQNTLASLLPNPVVSYYKENLHLGRQRGGEWILSGSLPVGFLWTRWPKIDAATAEVEAETLSLANVQRLIKFEVQKAFVECYYAAREFQGWQKAAAVLREAARAGQIRFADGDIAGYEHQRILLERLRYQKAETEARLDLVDAQRQLAFLLNPEKSELQFELLGSPLPEIYDVELEELVAQAMQSRPDLRAARARLRSRQAAVRAAQWQRLPEATVFFGYKQSADRFRGSVVQINFGLPIFNQNRGQLQSARAAHQQEISAMKLLENQVKLEVQQAYDRHKIYREQVMQFLRVQPQPPEHLLEIAQFSYAEGEMSLLELLDGVRAYVGSFQTRNDVILKYQLSIFELEKATGISIGRESNF